MRSDSMKNCRSIIFEMILRLKISMQLAGLSLSGKRVTTPNEKVMKEKLQSVRS